MTYIFWQNIMSIHQSAFIRNLAIENEVILIVEEGVSEERAKQGWNIPDFGKATVLIKPKSLQVSKMLDYKNAIHIFTGISSFPMVYDVFKKAIKKGCDIFVQLESYNYVDSKAFLRAWKYKILNWRYGDKIKGLLTIGRAAKKCFLEAGFSENKIFDWAYFTENPNVNLENNNQNIAVNLLFVGSIDLRKNILNVLPIIERNLALIEKIDIIGQGVLEKELLKFDDVQINYLGAVPNKEIAKYFSHADVLILPSIYDGWGAVINEALMVGTKVLCSDTCGARDLIQDYRGIVFSHNHNDFEEKLIKIINDGPVSYHQRIEIKAWASRSISGESASEYFLKIVDHVFNNQPKPTAPWI